MTGPKIIPGRGGARRHFDAKLRLHAHARPRKDTIHGMLVFCRQAGMFQACGFCCSAARAAVGKVERSRARGRVGEKYLDGPGGAIQLRVVDLFLWLVRD